jgi:flavin reductase (DIM6/NTAB) family NADH-FMN oxidoreductase RutF
MTTDQLDQIDSALRLLDRELWIITADDGPCRGGLIATWVSSASIDRERPVLLAGLAPNHFTTELVQSSRAFAAHLLRPEQTEIAWNFARDSGRDRNKFKDLEVEFHETGSPILKDCLAWFDCCVFARYDAGDRLFLWADIVAGTLRLPLHAENEENGRRSLATTLPLCEQQFFRSLTNDQRQHLLASRDADTAYLRPLHEKWRLTSPC